MVADAISKAVDKRIRLMRVNESEDKSDLALRVQHNDGIQMEKCLSQICFIIGVNIIERCSLCCIYRITSTKSIIKSKQRLVTFPQ